MAIEQQAVQLHPAVDPLDVDRRFTGLLDELCEELTTLRQAADPARCTLQGVVARRMHAAVAPFAADHFITPMAAVAGAVAQEIVAALGKVKPEIKAFVIDYTNKLVK